MAAQFFLCIRTSMPPPRQFPDALHQALTGLFWFPLTENDDTRLTLFWSVPEGLSVCPVVLYPLLLPVV